MATSDRTLLILLILIIDSVKISIKWGLGSGVFGSLEAVPIDTGGTARFAPVISSEARAAKLESWRAAVEATYGWADRV